MLCHQINGIVFKTKSNKSVFGQQKRKKTREKIRSTNASYRCDDVKQECRYKWQMSFF